MNKNIDLHLDDVRDDMRDKVGHYESAVDLFEDITKAVFWAGVENDPLSECEGFGTFDVWGMFTAACKLDRYVDYSREYLADARESVVTSCYLIVSQDGEFIHVCGCEPTSHYDSMYDGRCLIIKVLVGKSGKIIATCL